MNLAITDQLKVTIHDFQSVAQAQYWIRIALGGRLLSRII